MQVLAVLIGIGALVLLIWFPLLEGRAKNLDLISIYNDPFILYGYAASIAFFIGLYQVFRLFGYMRQNRLYAPPAVLALKRIKHCAIILGMSIVAAGIYIKLFHGKEEDPAGFLALCILATMVSAVVAMLAAKYEKRLEKGI
jgi:MFS superfamily sulfate permease-like transporter